MAAIAVEHGNVPGARKLCSVIENAGEESCWLKVLQARIALLQQNQEAARRFAINAHSLGTQEPHLANQLGVVLSRTGWHSEAVEPFQTAVKSVPGNADYQYNLAVALQFVGRLTEAEANFSELVSLHPDHASGWLALVQLSKAPRQSWQQSLEEQFESSEDADTRLLFGHAIARLLEREEEWDRSFEWLQRAKRRKQAEVAHDRSVVEDLVSSAVEFTRTGEIANSPTGDQRPLFIVGMPRSGTTLVERILTSHSEVTSVGELSDFAIVLKKALATPGPLVLDPALIRKAATDHGLGAVGLDYVRRASALAGTAARFIDKMPFNSFFVPAILSAIPGARVICLRRSPRDLVFANYRQLFATGFSYYSYAYDFGDTAHFVAQYERLAREYEAALSPARFHTVHYENIISNQRSETERLLEFCGLDWEDACMEFHRNAEPVATASSVQVRSPLYSSSVEQWRRYTEGGQLAIAELRKHGIEAE